MIQNSYNDSPTLYLISTPIGNLEDMTYRSVKILNEVSVVFSEDTRVTLNLLTHYGINKKLIALHEHNEDTAKEKVLDYLKNGDSVALVTDRGTPIISDPGYKTVKYISDNGYKLLHFLELLHLFQHLLLLVLHHNHFCFMDFLIAKIVLERKS